MPASSPEGPGSVMTLNWFLRAPHQGCRQPQTLAGWTAIMSIGRSPRCSPALGTTGYFAGDVGEITGMLPLAGGDMTGIVLPIDGGR